MYDSKSKTWDSLTSDQIESTAQAVSVLMEEYDISVPSVRIHEDVSWKTEGEGGVVWNAIKGQIDRD